MKKNVLMAGVAAIVSLATFTLLPAQEPSPGTQPKEGKQKGIVTFTTQPVNGNTVTGAPYSADAVTETTQTLGDGNRIERTSSVKLYRDGQGRERQEEGAPEATRIIISDPVAKASFTLNPQTHTAQKSPAPGGFFYNYYFNSGEALSADAAAGLAAVRDQAQALELQISDLAGARAGGSTARTPTIYLDGISTITVPIRMASGSPDPATEQLSPKTIEGVFANGTRTTHTIPAGQIGNQLPIQVVDEVWYSPDLQMNVMTRHSDPRTGEVVYQLKNISRGEPDASLFQVPPDYKINEGGGRGGRGRGSVTP
jgi:hypothetical protein